MTLTTETAVDKARRLATTDTLHRAIKMLNGAKELITDEQKWTAEALIYQNENGELVACYAYEINDARLASAVRFSLLGALCAASQEGACGSSEVVIRDYVPVADVLDPLLVEALHLPNENNSYEWSTSVMHTHKGALSVIDDVLGTCETWLSALQRAQSN